MPAKGFGIYFKRGVDKGDFQFLTKNCEKLMVGCIRYCQDNDLRFEITSLISDRDGVESSSKTHEEGRAFDLSVRTWTPVEIRMFVDHICEEFRDIAAISASDFVPRAAIYHDVGHGSHIHCQVKPGPRYGA